MDDQEGTGYGVVLVIAIIALTFLGAAWIGDSISAHLADKADKDLQRTTVQTQAEIEKQRDYLAFLTAQTTIAQAQASTQPTGIAPGLALGGLVLAFVAGWLVGQQVGQARLIDQARRQAQQGPP